MDGRLESRLCAAFPDWGEVAAFIVR